MWALTFLIITLIIWFLFTRKKHHSSLPPGPSGLPLVGNLFSLEPQLHSYFTALAKAHGPIFSLRLGTKVAIVVSSPAIAKEVLKDNDTIFANHDVPAAARAASYGGKDIPWTPYGPEWRLLRKVCVREMLSAATLDAVYGLRRQEVRRAIGLISARARASSPVIIGEEMFLVAMNVLTGMLWGGTVAKADERESLGREFRQAVAGMTALLGVPNVSDFYPVLAKLDLQGVEKRMKVIAEKFDSIFERVIKQRLNMDRELKGGKNKDFLQVLLQLKDDYEGQHDDNEVKFSMVHLKSLLMDMVVGGTDTTSNTVEFAMAEVLNKPDVLKKIQQELDSVIGKDKIVEEHHICQLPYLQAVMKETLRLHPVLPLQIPHCPSESCIVGGYTIPKESRVFINVWAIQRDPSMWPNPLDFDPERFMNAKFDFSGNNFNYFPFGSGRRICVGIGMAERMVLFSLASLLHSFDWKLPEGDRLNVEEKFGIVLTKRVPLVVIPELRLPNSALYE